MCALRFRGHRYRDEHGFVDDDLLDTYFCTGELTGEPLEKWTAFFIRQRGLGGWGRGGCGETHAAPGFLGRCAAPTGIFLGAQPGKEEFFEKLGYEPSLNAYQSCWMRSRFKKCKRTREWVELRGAGAADWMQIVALRSGGAPGGIVERLHAARCVNQQVSAR